MRTAFIGLGVMGHPMAGHLFRFGHRVAAYDCTEGNRKRWAAWHGRRVAGCQAKATVDAVRTRALVPRGKEVQTLIPAAGDATLTLRQLVFVDHTMVSGLNFALTAGLDPEAVVNVISKRTARSWPMDNRHKTKLAGKCERGIAVGWMCKGPAVCFDEVTRKGRRSRGNSRLKGSMPKSRQWEVEVGILRASSPV